MSKRFGNVEPLKNGKARARYTYRGVKHQKTCANEEQARMWLNQREGDILKGSHIGTTKMTFAEVAQEMLDEHVEPRAGTIQGYRSILEFALLPEFGHRQIAQIEVADWRAFVRHMEKTKASGTVRNYRAVMNLVFTYAIGQRYLSPGANPCPFVKIKKPERDEAIFLTAEQVQKLSSCTNKANGLAIRMMGYCGFRAGELWALKVGDINLNGGRCQVTKSVREVSGKGLITETAPKTGQWRSVSLPPQIVRDLALHIKDKDVDDFVFTSSNGHQIRHHNWRRDVWTKALDIADLGITPRVHDLRHTCAALYFKAGRTGEEVRRVLGHSTIQTTIRHYAHIWPDAFDRMVEDIGDFLAEVESQVTT